MKRPDREKREKLVKWKNDIETGDLKRNTERERESKRKKRTDQGILNREASLYGWPPV
jgi:hypothetical protein